jgi:hypothetical protein
VLLASGADRRRRELVGVVIAALVAFSGKNFPLGLVGVRSPTTPRYGSAARRSRSAFSCSIAGSRAYVLDALA